MLMQPVRSSAIAAVGYDATTRKLRIRFVGNVITYDFCNVPSHIYSGLLLATSKGRYYRTFIQGRYPC